MQLRALIFASLLLTSARLSAQDVPAIHEQPTVKPPAPPAPVESVITTYAGLGLGGFIPMQESFRGNYSTDLAGLPFELHGFVQFPASIRTLAHVGIRFTRSEAIAFTATEIRMVQLEPGIRYYIQPPERMQREDGSMRSELGLYAGAGGQISRTSVYGVIQETRNGEFPQPREVTKDHFNLGVGLDIGLTYPFSSRNFLDAGLHISSYLNDQTRLGGLGNIGGVSFNAAYRFGF